MRAALAMIALSAAILMFSCTPEDQCGTVTGWDINENYDYIVYIDGNPHNVIASTFFDAQVGDYMCIEY
jgi:hypothetical protein